MLAASALGRGSKNATLSVTRWRTGSFWFTKRWIVSARKKEEEDVKAKNVADMETFSYWRQCGGRAETRGEHNDCTLCIFLLPVSLKMTSRGWHALCSCVLVYLWCAHSATDGGTCSNEISPALLYMFPCLSPLFLSDGRRDMKEVVKNFCSQMGPV